MEYEQNARAGVAVEQRPLESIASAVQRVNNATVRIGEFLERFHGNEPKGDTGVEAETRTPHAVNLNRLFSALERLESRVDSLNAIG